VLDLKKVYKQFISLESKFLIADVSLSKFIAKRARLCAQDMFIANIPRFFHDNDDGQISFTNVSLMAS